MYVFQQVHTQNALPGIVQLTTEGLLHCMGIKNGERQKKLMQRFQTIRKLYYDNSLGAFKELFDPKEETQKNFMAWTPKVILYTVDGSSKERFPKTESWCCNDCGPKS